jgi:hypothetical protein
MHGPFKTVFEREREKGDGGRGKGGSEGGSKDCVPESDTILTTVAVHA